MLNLCTCSHSEHGLQINAYDPTHTTTIRNAFARAMGARFRALTRAIKKKIVDDDCFGLTTSEFTVTTMAMREFDFPRSADKVESFMEWLREQTDITILERNQIGRGVEKAWTDLYIQSAYQKGIYRGRQELQNAGYPVPPIVEATGTVAGGIAAAFNQPFHIDRVGLMYSRTYTGLQGITAEMDLQISRILAQGIADGRHPRELARLITRTVSGPGGDLAITDSLGRYIPAERRAKMLARTDMIRAHHEANMQEYRNYGALGIRVKAEFVTAGDGRVCVICQGYEFQSQAKPFTLDEVQGLIPVHPNCRCIAIPIDYTDRKD